MISSIVFLKDLKEYEAREPLCSFAAFSKRAHECRFRALWENRHNDKFKMP